jgi:hypothetical protein
MPVQITVEKANQLVFEQGAFNSLETLMREYGVSQEKGGRLLGEFFRLLLLQIIEAKNETRHIQAALARMEQTCREGGRANPRGYGQVRSPLIDIFHRDLWALDGWVVCLLETDLTLVGFVSHAFARSKVNQLNQAMMTLLQKREAGLFPFLKDPALFADYFI